MNTNTNSDIPSLFELYYDYGSLTYDLRKKSRKRLSRRDADMHFGVLEYRGIIEEYKLQ